MSSRKSKHNKNSSTSNGKKGEGDYMRQGNSTNNGNDSLSAVTFKYPGRFATLTRTILLNESLSTTELLRKVILSPSSSPPEAKKVFELYYMDEIYPFINKHAQETINTKKAIEKSWNLQTNHFQKIYVKRSEMLRIKWMEMKSLNKKRKYNDYDDGNSGSYTVTNHHHNHCSKNDEQHTDVSSLEAKSTTVIFKYYSVHSSAKTNRHIFITSPTREELCNKIQLTLSSNPPSAKELFEVYYYDEILPFLKKSGQQSIRGKKDLGKVWQIQTKTFKGLYEDRAKVLAEEWIKLKSGNKQSRHKNKKGKKNHNQVLITQNNIKWKPQMKIKEKLKKIERIECGLIRTLLNFILFVECTTKEGCFMLLIEDQNDKYIKYDGFKKYINKLMTEDLCYLHLRVCIDNFDATDLRLHTGQNIIKLCFINPNDPLEELILFEIKWDKIIQTLDQFIDHEHIVSSLDQETRILSINVPAINLK